MSKRYIAYILAALLGMPTVIYLLALTVQKLMSFVSLPGTESIINFAIGTVVLLIMGVSIAYGTMHRTS